MDLPACSDLNTLTGAERALLSDYENESGVLYGLGVTGEVWSSMLAGWDVPIEAVKDAVRDNGPRVWLASHGWFVHKDKSASGWTLEQHVPHLERVVPLSESTAVGWSPELELYVTHDSGAVWRPLPLAGPAERPIRSLEANPTGQGVWALTEDGLYLIPFDDLEPQRLLGVQPDEELENFAVSPNGEVLSARADGWERLYLSTNAGESWQTLDLGPLTHVDEAYRGPVDTTYADSGHCYLLLEDGTIFDLRRAGGEIQSSLEPVARLPEDAYPVEGYLRVSPDGETMVLIRLEADPLRSQDAGRHWKPVPLHVDAYWGEPQPFRGPDSYVVPGERDVIIINALRDDWLAVNPTWWDDVIRACWDPAGNDLYLLSDLLLAMSTDSGKSWTRNQDPLPNPPFCGINRNLLWLKYDSIKVFRLPVDAGRG